MTKTRGHNRLFSLRLRLIQEVMLLQAESESTKLAPATLLFCVSRMNMTR